MPYAHELLTVITISIFMAISPGADFVMVTRNSIFYGRKSGVWASIGISLAIWFHVAYSIAGLAVIISQSIVLYSVIKYLGAMYLIYIGLKTLFFKNLPDITESNDRQQTMSAADSFKSGFICNVLNPKTTIFFMSIFTQVVNVDTPLWVQLLFGGIISLAHLLWFSVVATLLSQKQLLKYFERFKVWIERVVGSVLILFGVKVALSD